MNLQLAPLAGISDAVYRLICFENSADRATTEMISAQGYLSAPKNSTAYRLLTDKFQEEGELYAQVFGKDAHLLADASKLLKDMGKFQGISINMGCPAHKVSGGGSGVALMKNPSLAAEIIRSVRKSVNLPISVKIRLGWDSNIAPSFAKMLESEGADEVVIHGRTRGQQFSGKADWYAMAEVKKSLNIPVIANGDVFSPEDYFKLIKICPFDGVMIGRGALGRPWIFEQIKAQAIGEVYDPPNVKEIVDIAMRHANMLSDWKGEDRAVLEMRKHFSWYIKGIRGAAEVRRKLNTLPNLAQVEELLYSFAHHSQKEETYG